jgi:hypothetical protein
MILINSRLPKKAGADNQALNLDYLEKVSSGQFGMAAHLSEPCSLPFSLFLSFALN